MHTLTGILRQPEVHVRRHLCSSTIGWIALTVMILAGSTTASFGKQLTTYFSPLSMLFLSEVMLLLFAVISFGFFPIFKHLRRVRREIVLPLFTAGVLNGVLAPALWFTGLTRTFAINSQWFGGSVIFFGLLVVALHGFTERLSIANGDLLIVLAGALYGLGGVLIRKYLRHLEPQVIIVVRSCCAIAFFFLLSPFISHPFVTELQAFPWEFLGVLLGYGLISRFLLIFSYYESLEHLPLPTVSFMGTVTVGTGLLFAHWYLGESILWYQSAGAALVILGAVIAQWGNLRKLEGHVVHFLKSHHQH